MATRQCTGTIAAVSNAQANASLTAFLWCTTAGIQAYLDTQSTIVLGDNYELSSAKILENDAVQEIVSYLLAVYTITTATDSAILKVQATKLVAAQIAMGRMGASMGMELAEFAERLKNEAWSTLQRIFVSQSLPAAEATAKTVSFALRIFFSKLRERTVVPDA